MAESLGGGVRARRWGCMLALMSAIPCANLRAGDFDLWGFANADYKLTLSYALAMRTKNPDPALVDGPVDPFQSQFNPGTPQPVGFTQTGLPNTINFDDGNRNFKKWALINNRLSAYGEVNFSRENYGAVFSGSAFYDQVYRESNDNDSPPGQTNGATVNKLGEPNEFTSETRKFSGQRARLLEAYGYFDLDLGEESHLNLRLGQQLVAWGESLFLSGVALAQGPADANKAFVPGAEIKDILLPVNQIALRLSLNDAVTLLAQYKLAFKPTELFPVGDFFSPADLIGPGATFIYGSLNPAFGDGCPGLLAVAGFPDLSFLCEQGGAGGPLLGAEPYIIVNRGPDIEPGKHGQYGFGITAQLTSTFNLGLYRLRYADTNPAVVLNTGFAVVATRPTVITTEAFNQFVPVTYQIKYFGGIDMTALSFSTVAGPFNIAGEVSYRQNLDMQVQAVISGVLSPVYTTGNLEQVLLSSIYASNPGFLVDDIAVVGEFGIIRVTSVDEFPADNGIEPVGDGRQLFADKTASGFQVLAIGGNHNVLSGWDLKTQLNYAMIIKGNPAMAGAFGSLFGEGDKRLGVSASMTYLANLEFSLGYNLFFGDPEKRVRGISPVIQNPFADRDYVSFNIKYNL